MPDQVNIPERDPSRTTGPARQASQVSKQEYAARAERWKEGSPLEWQAMLRDMEKNGELLRSSDGLDDLDEDQFDEDISESEIDLADEDALRSDDSATLDELLGGEFLLGLDENAAKGGASPGPSNALFRIVVSGSGCRLEIPSWLAGAPPEEDANHPLVDPFQRLETFQRLARWLSEERRAFLREPDPWHLGVNALDELRKGTPSVTEDGLLSLLSLKAEINRHKRLCDLVWEDGSSLPLDFLFRAEAKQAWVANALIERYRETPPNEETLDRYAYLTVPKQGREKKELLVKNVDALSFPQFIQRLCLESHTPWSGVIGSYRDRILNKFQEI